MKGYLSVSSSWEISSDSSTALAFATSIERMWLYAFDNFASRTYDTNRVIAQQHQLHSNSVQSPSKAHMMPYFDFMLGVLGAVQQLLFPQPQGRQ